MSVAAAENTPQWADHGAICQLFETKFNVDTRTMERLAQVTTGKFYTKLLNVGDQVTVSELPDFSGAISDYKKNTTGRATTFVAPGKTVMTVARAKDFKIGIDAVDLKQTHLMLKPAYIEKLQYEVRKQVETAFWADVVTRADAANMGLAAGKISKNIDCGTAADPVALTKINVVDVYNAAYQALEENDFAEGYGQLWMVGPSYLRYALMGSDLKNAGLTGDPKSIQRTNQIGMINGFKTMTSNLLPAGYLVAGNMEAISYISQLNRVSIIEAKNNIDGHYDVLKGLYVYDWKVRCPKGLVVFSVSDSTKS